MNGTSLWKSELVRLRVSFPPHLPVLRVLITNITELFVPDYASTNKA